MVTISVNGLMNTIAASAFAYGNRAAKIRSQIKDRMQEVASIKEMVEIGEMTLEDAQDQLCELKEEQENDLTELRKIAESTKRLNEISKTIDSKISGKKEGDDN